MRSYILQVVKYHKWVLLITLLVTAGLLAQLRSLTVIIDPDNVLPQSHPYVETGNILEQAFGNKFTVVIGLTPNTGDIYQVSVLEKIQRITARIQNSPLAIKNNIASLSSRKTKNIEGTEEGMIVRPLMEKVPATKAAMDDFKDGIARNPVFENLLVSKDGRTTQIVAEFKRSKGGFQEIAQTIERAVTPERDNTVEIDVAGAAMYLSLLEKYSARMVILFPVAILIIALILFQAFRTAQAMFLPLVTALLAVSWSMGFLGFMNQPFDIFNASTPILVLAIAAGHAVQILKRYYEEFALAKESNSNLSARQLSELAVVNSLSKVGVVMIVACTVAALGFFSLTIFDIKSIRTFGLFTGAGVVSALILELTFIPALRVMLPPPSDKEIFHESKVGFWERLVGRFHYLAVFQRRKIYWTVGIAVVVLSVGGYWLKVDNSQKSYFSATNPVRLATDSLNEKMAGTNPIFLLVKGDSEDAIKRPATLEFMASLQAELDTDPRVGKTVSLVDFIKRMNQSMHADKQEFYAVPKNQNLVAQYLLLYSSSGEPGDFDSYVDYNYQNAKITVFLKSDSSAYIESVIRRIMVYASDHSPPGISIDLGGGSLSGVALNEIMVREKILNILQIMGAVFLVTSLVFRSFLAGFLILTPLIAAVFVNFGIMGLFGIPLQIGTALVSAMAVGIGADYGIYMSYRMREELRHNTDESVAIERSFRSAGKAVIFVSSAVAGGFGVLMFSWGFMLHIWMGFLIALAMLVSSITALTVFPALILTLRPRFIFGDRKHDRQIKGAKV